MNRTDEKYLGIYELLDELIKRIKDQHINSTTYVDKYCETFIKVYRELKEDKENLYRYTPEKGFELVGDEDAT